MTSKHARRRPALHPTPIAAALASLFVLANSLSAAPIAQAQARPFDGSLMSRGLSAGILPSRLDQSIQAASANPAAPAVVTSAVTSCGDAADDFTTLRHAVLTANPGDTIDLSGLLCSKITLTNGAIAVIVDDLTIKGRAATALTIDGNLSDRVFKHSGTGTLTLVDLTVANGVISADKAYGGCVYSKGSLTLTRATLTSCKALGQTLGAGGGALAFHDVTVDSSVVSDNLADAAVGLPKQIGASSGGVLAAGQGSGEGLTVLHSLISGNTVHAASGLAEGGGGVGFAATVKYSTLTGNKAQAAGNTDNYSGAGGIAALYSLSMSNSTVDHNEADVGGGIFLSSNGFGTIIQSTLSGNKANFAAGAIDAASPLSLANCTVAFNTAGVYGGGGVAVGSMLNATLQGTIMADNIPTDFDGGAVVSGSNNLVKVIGPNTTLPMGTLALDPQLGPLAYNGGITRTHALSAGSPAINAGNNVANLSTDERGGSYARVVGVAADIGAVEFDPDRIFTDGVDAP